MYGGTRRFHDIPTCGDDMKDLILGDYPWPLPRSTDGMMDRAILEHSQTGVHPCETNRLGKEIGQGVVTQAFEYMESSG